MYKQVIRPLFFRFDPETVHKLTLASLGWLHRLPALEGFTSSIFQHRDPRLEVHAFNLTFKNPIGLAAGFDKECEAFEFLAALGFSHIEVGTVTAQAQPGNPCPRIFRFPDDQALINRMGFPSTGVNALVPRLERLRSRPQPALVGINFGKTKSVPVDAAVEDYLVSFNRTKALGDYYVINVSSPNTPELRKLQERTRLSQLFRALTEANIEKRPLLVKVAPDLTFAEIDDVLDCCLASGIAGIVATNTTLTRNGLSVATSEAGGLSGRPLSSRSLEVVRYIHAQSQGKIPIIGVGGIFSVSDLLNMISAGASLVQIYTGFIYEGPALIQRLTRSLSAYLDQHGIKSLAEIKGVKIPAPASEPTLASSQTEAA